MSISRVSVGTPHFVFNGNNAPAIQTGFTPSVGDLLVWATGEFAGSDAAPAAPTGTANTWTLRQSPTVHAGQLAVYTAPALGGGSDVIPGVNWGNQWTWGVVIVLRGVNVTTPLDAMSGSNLDRLANQSNLVGPANTLTPLGNGEYALFFGQKDCTSGSSAQSFTAPSGWTMVSQSSGPTGISTGPAFGICEQLQTTAATIAANTAMSNVVNDSNAMQGLILVFQPAAGAALAGIASVASSATANPDQMAASAAAQVAAQAILTTAIQAAAAASVAVSASGVLTNWSTVTLSGTQYTGPGGIHDPNFWLDVNPAVGTTLYYDGTNITIYSNGEISATTNNCSAIVQFFDGTAWSVGTIIITPQMVSYATILAAAVGALSTAITMAGVALSATSAGAGLTTGIALATNAVAVANAAATLSSGVQLNTQALINASASGALTGGVASLQGAAHVLSQAVAGLTAKIQLAGQVALNSTVAGGLATQILLDGAAQSLAQANAQILTAIQLAGNASVTSSAAGAALISSALAGVATTVWNATGALLTGLQIAGNALVQISVAGDLSTGVQLAGGAIVDTAASIQPVGPESQFGRAIIIIYSPNGLPEANPTFIVGSAVYATIAYFNAQGQPFIPSAVSYSVQDIDTGFTVVPATSIGNLNTSNAVTIPGSANQIVNLTRSFEERQLLFQVVDAFNNINYVSAPFEILLQRGGLN